MHRYIVWEIYCQQLWSVVQLGGVCVPFGHKVGACTCSRHIFVLDMFCQQFWGVVRLRGVHLYWIYSANECCSVVGCDRMIACFGDRTSARRTSARLQNVDFLPDWKLGAKSG